MRIKQLRMLDCFCGLGGASNGFHEAGFDVQGIEINPRIAKRYPYPVLVADVLSLDPQKYRGFDVIWGSPPCRDFSTVTQANKGYPDRKPPMPEEGLKLVYGFLKFVEIAQPKIWLMENVRRLEIYYGIPPKLHFLISKMGKRSLWSNIDFPFMVMDYRPQRNMKFDYVKLGYAERSMRRAKIPTPISHAIAEVCKQKLEGAE